MCGIYRSVYLDSSNNFNGQCWFNSWQSVEFRYGCLSSSPSGSLGKGNYQRSTYWIPLENCWTLKIWNCQYSRKNHLKQLKEHTALRCCCLISFTEWFQYTSAPIKSIPKIVRYIVQNAFSRTINLLIHHHLQSVVDLTSPQLMPVLSNRNFLFCCIFQEHSVIVWLQ